MKHVYAAYVFGDSLGSFFLKEIEPTRPKICIGI